MDNKANLELSFVLGFGPLGCFFPSKKITKHEQAKKLPFPCLKQSYEFLCRGLTVYQSYNFEVPQQAVV